MNSPDIKPKRSETLINTKRRNIGGSSLLFISLIGLVNFIGLLMLGLWFFNSSGYQQEAGQNFVERISLLEEKTSADQDLKNELIFSLEDDIKLSDLAEKNDLDFKEMLFGSIAMRAMRKRYGHFAINEDDTIGDVIEKMHNIMPF